MAYTNETSSVKTIVPGAEVSGFCDVVARQKISELSGEVPQLSAGEGIAITTTDGKTVITNNISAGSNISLVYDMETNTYRIDGQGGSVEGLYVPLSAKNCTIGNSNSAGIDAWGATADNSFAQGDSNSAFAHSYTQGNGNSACWQSMAQGERNISHNQSLTQGTTNSAVNYSQALGNANTASYYSFAAGFRNFASRHSQALGLRLNISGSLASGGFAIGSCNKLSSDVSFVIGNGTSTANRSDAFVIYPDGKVSAAGKISANGVELGAGKTYTGVAPIQVNNATDEISITGESLSAGPGIDMFSSGGYVVISSDGGNPFPITGTNGTTGFTANMDCSSMMLTTGASPAGGYVKQTVRGVQYEAYPATDVSASWYNIINGANNVNVTCSAVKLTTAASENWFYTSALPNLNEITFIAPSYGPYETYSALIDDGETTFVAEVDSGCCMKVVRNWNDDRNKNCWCGLNQETYFYIG